MRNSIILYATTIFGASPPAISATIDCSSAQVDPKSGGDGITSDSCRAQCIDICADVKTSDDLETCLTNDSLKGCLFNVGNAKENRIDYCIINNNNGSGGGSSSNTDGGAGGSSSGLSTGAVGGSGDDNTPTTGKSKILVRFAGEDLYVINEKDVTDVQVVLTLEDTTLFKSCANKNILVGVSATKYADCTYEGTPTIAKQYVISGQDMLIPVEAALTGLWGSKDDAAIIIQLEDITCGSPDVTDATSYFSMSYQSGYIDKTTCYAIGDCLTCKAANCHWCSWQGVVDTVLPSWLPDWDWVQSAKNGENGKCGLNSALCNISAGSYDTCGVNVRFSRSFVALILMVVFLGFSSV